MFTATDNFDGSDVGTNYQRYKDLRFYTSGQGNPNQSNILIMHTWINAEAYALIALIIGV